MRDATLLAFDFGLQRIGVAVGEVRLGQARALSCIASENNAARFAAIGKLIAEWRPARLLVGKPLNVDGAPHEMTARCARFADQLRGRFQLPVEEVDERFSSVEADAALRELSSASSSRPPSRQRRLSLNPYMDWQERKAQVDAEAARVILQSWLEAHAHEVA
ncbi:MAG: Holliday junction resolvase RuvX [Rugosibacter sp.]